MYIDSCMNIVNDIYIDNITNGSEKSYVNNHNVF